MKTKIEAPMAVEMPTRLNLEGKHAKKFAKHKIGAKVKMLVHARKVSHNVYGSSKGDNHSVGFDISKIETPNEDPKHEAKETPAEEAYEQKTGREIQA